MQLGIFAKTFVRPNLEETLDAVKSFGLECVQFNFSCVGMPTLPHVIEPELAQRIRGELAKRSLSMAAVSGTCNLIHPDEAHRADGIRRLGTLIASCRELGTSIVTLCTGTRDPDDMWRAHPENQSPDAWRDLRMSLETLLPVAEKHRVSLGVEPEPGNVIDSARKARRLLDEFKSPWIKIIFDGANLVASHGLSKQHPILSEAADLLGPDIVLAHAKDLIGTNTQDAPGHVAAGKGKLDYLHFFSLLRKNGFEGPIILHGLSESEVSASIAFLREKLVRAAGGGEGPAKTHAIVQAGQP